MFEKVGIVSVPVKDQERAKKFFVETLEFIVVRDDPYMEGSRWIELAPKGAQTSISLVTWFEGMPAGGLQGIVLKATDIEKAHDTIAHSAATEVTDIDKAPWGSSFMFNDPEGNGWIVQQD